MTVDLDAILDYVDALRELDTTGVEPMTHAVPFDCPLRPIDARPRCRSTRPWRTPPAARPASSRFPASSPGPAGPPPRTSRDRRRAGPAWCRSSTAVRAGKLQRARGDRAVPGPGSPAGRRAGMLTCRSTTPAPAAGRRRRRRPSRRSAIPGRWPARRIGIKDIFCMRGVETTCASKILRGFVPPYESTVTARLAAAGAVALGKLNMDEFAMGSSTENSSVKPTRNPWSPAHVPGGSSGGSAAAVAASLCAGATGTDTGGSIRQPAALCGVVGMKPTYGRVSRYGVIAFASSLDHPGPFGRTVEDAAALLEVMAGADPLDATSIPAPVGAYRQAARAGREGSLRACAWACRPSTSSPAWTPRSRRPCARRSTSWPRRARRSSRSRCRTPSTPSRPTTSSARPRRRRTWPATTGSSTATAPPRRGRSRSSTPRRAAKASAPSPSGGSCWAPTCCAPATTRPTTARRCGRAARSPTTSRRRSRQCDAIVTPTSPVPAFKFGERIGDPLQMYLADIFTVAPNLAGVPALSQPCGFTKAGLPIGLQIIGPALGEEMLLPRRRRLRIAHRLAHARRRRRPRRMATDWEVVDRAGGARPARHAVEDLLLVVDGVRRRAERGDRSGLPGDAGDAAGSEPLGRRIGGAAGDGRRLQHPHALPLRAQALLLSGSPQGLSNLAVRRADLRGGRHQVPPEAARRARSA